MTTGWVVKSDGFPHILLDPQAIMPLTFDFTDWMVQKGAASLASATVTVPAELTAVGAVTIDGGKVTRSVKVTAGTTSGSYKVVWHVVVAAGVLEDDRTGVVDVVER